MRVKDFVKKHIVLIIILTIVFVFPVSLSNQTKLSMRVIITGLAFDKEDDKYTVTAQIVKTTPGNESPGTSAEIDFVSDEGETIGIALSNLMYKTGKVSAFSHTSFVILGKGVTDEGVSKCLDIFLRDKTMRSSTLLLVSENKASDEIKKTKQIPLSVGIGLQKVFSFREEQSDALMISVLDFLTHTNSFSHTAFASVIKFEENEIKQEESGQQQGGESQTASSGSQQEKSLFKSKTPINAFVNGKFACQFSDYDEINAFMIANPKTKHTDVVVKDLQSGRFGGGRATISIKDKIVLRKIRFENKKPCIDLSIDITNSDIMEVISEETLSDLTNEEYDEIEEKLKQTLKENVASLFEKAKQNKVDLFSAIELAYKYKYNDYILNYENNNEKFLEDLKINVNIIVSKLDY